MAVRFNAATDQLALAAAPSSTSAITVTAWVRNQEGVSFGTLLRLRAGGTVFGFTASSSGVNGPQINTTGGAAGPITIGGGDSLPVGSWRFVAMTIDSSNGTVYWDDATGGSLTTASGTVATGSPTALSVGGRGDEPSDRWGGDIAHKRIWTAVLTPTEIAAERDSATHVRTSDIWAAWELPDASTLTDSSGNGRHLTAGSTSVDTTDGPAFDPGGTSGALAGTTAAPSGALTGQHIAAGALAASTGAPTGTLAATLAATGALAAATPAPTGALTGALTIVGALDAGTAAPSGTLAGGVPAVGALAGVTAAPSGALAGTVESSAPVESPGSWGPLLALVREARTYRPAPRPTACPDDGAPLQTVRGRLHCRFCGRGW